MLQNYQLLNEKNKNATVRQTVSLSLGWLPLGSDSNERVGERIDRLTARRTSTRFSSSSGVRMTDSAFLLRKIKTQMYWFDAEGDKKAKRSRE